ncbi:ClpXP protease specificity-enhancing factor [Veronia pacifica]|uniref:ClpXP protease specificity-enhancing factor n=1 Tax=Veronia pacifica TaxID=1080227 RepID=A0A1C3ELJ4_9GAMM|nr:ClpXP protease specificity-enhancing factor [Veronia pacifica]ODA34101.1 ClpXP protease specificity-enhancing factor [Veronia pacifica]
MSDISLTPRRPYMLRAFYDWILDNDLTPHLVVDAEQDDVIVPLEYVQDGQIVLNIAPRAVGNLSLGNDHVVFSARFGGRPMEVQVPLSAVLAIYARENGAGTMFEPEEAYEAASAEHVVEEPVEGYDVVEEEPTMEAVDAVKVEDDSEQDATDTAPDPEAPKKSKGRPTLTVVK